MTVTLQSVTFNHDPDTSRGSALNIRINGNTPAQVPEWINGVSSTTPAVFAFEGFPAFGERPFDGHLAVATDKPLVDVVQKRQDGCGVHRMGVHCLRVRGRGPTQCFGGRTHGAKHQCAANKCSFS